MRLKIIGRLMVAILLGLAIVSSGTATGLAASELTTKKNELKALGQKIEDHRRALAQKKKEEKAVLGQLQELQQGIETTRNNLEDLNGRLRLTRNRVRQTTGELHQAEQTLATRQAFFEQRLKEIYLNGNVSYFEVLLQSRSMTEFLDRFDLLQRVAEKDVDLLNEINVQRQLIKSKKNELERRQAEVTGLRNRTSAQQAALEEQSNDKEQLLDRIKSEKAAYEKALREYEQTSKQLERIIRKLQEQSRKTARIGNGRLGYPTTSTRVTSNYGMRYHPILKVRKLHTGVDFGARSGSPMYAAEGGTVIYTGWMGGYGKVVVIDHGGGLSTLYAHMSVIGVSEGRSVKRGQQIGQVGSTGWSTGPHAHFEVRENGTPVNPWKYL